MKYITGFDRSQATIFPQTIDELIEKDNPVRFIDAFVDSLQITEMGFKDVRQNIGNKYFVELAPKDTGVFQLTGLWYTEEKMNQDGQGMDTIGINTYYKLEREFIVK
jgi:hypothetical protein